MALTTGFTNGAGQIWLDDVACRGTEARLIDCLARPLGQHNCAHVEDVGVRCSTTTTAFGMENHIVMLSINLLVATYYWLINFSRYFKFTMR